MKYKGLLLSCLFAAMLFGACNKFDMSNLKGVHTEGEMLLPIANGAYTMVDLMERFEMDGLIDYDPDGSMSYNLLFDQMGLAKGSDLLKFNNLTLSESHQFSNPLPGQVLPFPIDTVFRFSQTVNFESEHISVWSATMKSGQFVFALSSNFAEIREVVIASRDIKDADGNDFTLVCRPASETPVIDLSGLRYETAEANRLVFSYEVGIRIQSFPMTDLELGLNLSGTGFAIKEMSGFVSPYNKRNRLDTVFSVFPDKVSGMIGVDNVLVTLSERNTFGLGASIVVDTAQISGGGIAPFDLVSPLPLAVEATPSPIFTQVFQQCLDSRLNAHAGHVYISSDLILNPEETNNLVVVNDESTIDLRVHAHVPFEFNIEDIHYADTVNLRLSQIDSPGWIKKLTLELTFVSTIPFNLDGKFMMYDSEHGTVTYTLLDNATLIAASYDGTPTTTVVTIEVADERLIQENIFKSDKIILDFDLDTDSHDVVLNANQYLNFTLKAKADYDGVIKLKK